jgi:predicted TIM-barrel fold metal-dependent hydrolase
VTSRARSGLYVAVALAATLAAAPARAADYAGPLVDAHSHVPNATAIDAYAAAMKRHNVGKVILLGVGGAQKDDAAWIAAAAKKYPGQVVAGQPVPDPTGASAAARLDGELAKSGAKAVGEIHVRQVSRKIDRSPADPAFVKLLEVAAKHKTPVVIHDELNAEATRSLEAALSAVPSATIVLAHGGESTPAALEGLLAKHSNLVVDLSGMHFQRTPALATEKGPLDAGWKALIVKHPDRFVMGIDVWAARLFEPAMLDRLMTWTRRILGELPPEVAERVAHRNATALFHLE